MSAPLEIRYYDLRYVAGQVTHIDIDNGVVESAGESFFNKAILRVLNGTGWGILQIDNYQPCTGKKFDDYLASASRLASITQEPVALGDAPRGILSVPPMKEDPRTVSIEEKSEILASIEKAAVHPLVVNRRANYIEKNEQVQFIDSSGNEFTYGMCRSGFNVLAVASRNGNVQMGYEREHSIHGFNLRGFFPGLLLVAEVEPVNGMLAFVAHLDIPVPGSDSKYVEPRPAHPVREFVS